MAEKLSESIENYLETILMIKQQRGVVRVKDISGRLDVSMPSVHSALHTLEDQGLIEHEKYGYVELTKQGSDRARKIYSTHQALTAFLSDVIGVQPSVAAQDACRIEHVISKETIDKITAFTRKTWKSKDAKGREAPDGAEIDITELGKGRSARVVRVDGGRQEVGRLEAMGIVAGVKIAKRSASLMHGPIVLEKGQMQVAIGYALAKKIIVEPEGR